MGSELEYGVGGGIAGGLPLGAENMNLAHMLDLGLMGASFALGVDVERELFRHLRGEVVLAVSSFEIEEWEESWKRVPVDAVLMLSHVVGAVGELDDSLGAMLEYLAFGMDIDRYDIGADRDAWIVDVEGTGYEPGFVVSDGWLIVGSTGRALDAVTDVMRESEDALASSRRYRQVMRHLGEPEHVLIYVDIHGLAAGVEKTEELSPDEMRFLREGLGKIAVVDDGNEEYQRLSVALTLFTEE